MGCVILFCVFWFFYKVFYDLGVFGLYYFVFYVFVYCNMVILGVEGFKFLFSNCFILCCVFFIVVIVINGMSDIVGKKWVSFIFFFMVMVMLFYFGVYFVIDMCIGSLMLFIWEKIDKVKVDVFGLVVVFGLICGDGMWMLFSLMLVLVGVNLFICMKFLLSKVNVKVDVFLIF